MSEIDDYESRRIRQKSFLQYQNYQANNDNVKGSNFDNHQPASTPIIGQISGRSVTQIDSSSQNIGLYTHLISTIEDQIRPNFVNTVKKTEPSHKKFHNLFN